MPQYDAIFAAILSHALVSRVTKKRTTNGYTLHVPRRPNHDPTGYDCSLGTFGKVPHRHRGAATAAAANAVVVERCALAGDQVGQEHAVGYEAGERCKLVDTVLKRGCKRQLAEAQKHMTPPWRHWSARPGAVLFLSCVLLGLPSPGRWPSSRGEEARQWGRKLCLSLPYSGG